MLNQLRLDHANMARLLHVLQLKQKTLAVGERPNFQLMREVV
ncbi:MAG: hemerythrin domain-containing protein, partial [Halomonas sp.]